MKELGFQIVTCVNVRFNSYRDVRTAPLRFAYQQELQELVRFFKEYAQRLNMYQDIFNVFSALSYYNMVVFWSGVPYITDYGWYEDMNFSIARTDETTILNDLKATLIRMESQMLKTI